MATTLLALTACSSGSGKDHASSSSTDPTSTTVHFTGDAGSAFCARLKDLNTQDVLKGDQGGSPADVEAGFARLRQVLNDTAAAAPEVLRRDITAIAAGIAALDDALRAVGYSYDALAHAPNALDVSAAVNDPAFSEAGARISAYKAQVCHL